MTATRLTATLILFAVLAPRAGAQGKSDRERDGLSGAVKSVRTETSFSECRAGQLAEAERSTSSEEYDPAGRVVGNRNRFKADDAVSKMLVYPFDESTPRIEQPAYGEDGALLYTDVYTYDNAGRRAEHARYKADGAVLYRSAFVFDGRGLLAESKAYNADGALASRNVLRRDERGNEAESSFYKEDGTLVEVHEGGCIHLNRFVSAYEFDSAGNWVKQTTAMPVLRDGRAELEPFAVKRRAITYY